MCDVINKNMKKTICFIIILIVFSGLIMMGIQLKYYVYYTTYCKDYYLVLANTESLRYEKIIEANGEPDKTTREKYTEYGDYFIYHEYDDGRLFVFTDNENGNGHPSLCVIELTSPQYRFGRKEIGIGTDKSTIEKVYRKSYQGLQQDAYGKYFVEDGNFVIDFYFDENDKVYKITVGKAEIRHGIRGWKRK
ncbi:MAG: hypothetical protein HDQ96_00525 [Lachnospiraceae bacterium]|nr:hypothetical protein [Lachnospiraceae bacterium]